MTDPLPEIKARWANKPEALEVSKAWALVDIRRLIGEVEDKRTQLVGALDGWRTESRVAIERGREVERLRGLLGRLEFACDTAQGWACPWCGMLGVHLDDCELAAEIHPPEGSQG